MESYDALVIGAGPAGLAATKALRDQGLTTALVEKADQVGAVWRRHYDRLKLHTSRRRSALPGLALPASVGRYPSRADFVAYLETYCARFALAPRFLTDVRAVRRAGAGWRAEAKGWSATARVAVVAAGMADFPRLPVWPGQERFGRPILHASAYRNAAPFAGARALVVGFGNSAADIALDIAEAGARVTMSVRGGVNILPHELLGAPILSYAFLTRPLPAAVADALSAPVLRLAVGPLEPLGLKRASKGPIRANLEDRRVPLVDNGVVAAIRAGRIAVRGDISSFAPGEVLFADGEAAPFDLVILATGWRADFRALLPDAGPALTGDGAPVVSDRPSPTPGLYFVGAFPSPHGQLRAIAQGARRVARHAAAYLRATAQA